MHLSRTLSLIFLTSVFMPGCDCGSHSASENQITSLPKDSSGLMVISEAMKENLEKNIKTFQFSLNDTDYHRHLSLYDQRMFQFEGLELDSIAARYKKGYKQGQYYEVQNVLVNKISPMIEDSGYYWVGIQAYVKMDIHYKESFKDNPKDLIGIVRDNFGPNVEYDSLLRVFHVDDNFVFYGTTLKDTIDFHFLRGTYFRVPQLSKLASFKTISTLKKYE